MYIYIYGEFVRPYLSRTHQRPYPFYDTPRVLYLAANFSMFLSIDRLVPGSDR